MTLVEHCVVFDCAGAPLVGIVAVPARVSPVGVVIVVGGPQYRVGSHRQFTLLARYLASQGHAVMRFDYRGMGDSGMGDSGGAKPDFLGVNDDIAAAVAALQRTVPQVTSVALWGLCDGASAALLYAGDMPPCSLAGLCLLNPWVRSAHSQATAQVKHYYTRRLRERDFWVKLLRGRVGLGRLTELAGSVRTVLATRRASRQPAPPQMGFQQRMALAWRRADCPLFLVLSGNDLTAKEFTDTLATDAAWRTALAHPQLTRLDLPDADHTFSDTAARLAVEQATLGWLSRLATPAGSPGAP